MANHVSHASLPFPVKGARFTMMLPFLDNDGDPTDPVTPDTEVNLDNGGWNDCAEEVTVLGSGAGSAFITLSGAETNASMIALQSKAASGPKTTLGNLYPRVLPPIFSGTAAAGAAGSLTLASDVPAIADLLVGCILRTTGGTGGGGTGGANNQARVITGFNSSRVATVSPNWETTPDATTTYEVLLTEFAFVRLADVVALGRSKQSADDLKDFADDGYDPATNQIVDPAGVGTLLTRISATRAGYLDNLSGGAVALASALSTLQGDINTLLSRLSAARAGYLDKLNITGQVAGQDDINALNQSASRRIIITSVQQYERPESGSVPITIEARTYDGDGAPANADSPPTLTATGSVTGSLAGNLSAASTPATGVYRWTYTVPSSHNVEQIRFDITATIGGTGFPLAHFAQVTDLVAANFSTSDRSKLDAIYNKLPSRSYLGGTTNATGAPLEADLPTVAGDAAAAKTAAQSADAKLTAPRLGALEDMATMVENDGTGSARLTAAALAQAPSGSGGATSQQIRDAMMLAPSAGTPAAGSVDKHLDDILAAGGGPGDPNVINILPVFSSVRTDPVRDLLLVAYTDAAITHRVAVFDSQGQPIDLTGKELQFVLETRAGEELGFLDDLAISGAGSNVITIEAAAALHPKAGCFRYAVRDVADEAGDRVWLRGEYRIDAAAGPHVES